MKAVVTGGAGFIGSIIVRSVLRAGWSVTVLDNFSTGFLENIPESPGLRVIRGDIRDDHAVDEALEGAEAVFHVAAAVGNLRSMEKPIEDSEINVLGTLRVLEGMRRAGVRRLIVSSSAAIFGEPRRLPIDEEHPAEPDSPYGVSKLAAEKHCLCYGRLYKWQVACLRYFNVYGVNQRYDAYGNVIPIFVSRVLRGEPLVVYGDGEQTRDFVDAEDVARANWLALERGVSGVFNIGSGTATAIRELAEMVQACAGRVVGAQFAAPRPGEVRHSVASLAASRQKLGYVPQVMLRDGLRRYVSWLSGDREALSSPATE
jgi:UDP-glucose 4-epimerase